MKNQRSGIGFEREKYWQDFWEKEGVYVFKKDSKNPVFSVDTPPPTVSGKLHLGHVFSYSQAEAVVRYHRMSGKNVFYPFGLDDNGLPTERIVESDCGVKAEEMEREKFVELVQSEVPKYHKKYIELFKMLGFSYDMSSMYSTISPEVRKRTQEVFIDLFKEGRIYRKKSPALYCCECKTSVAQAEVEDKEFDGIFFDLVFKKENGSPLVIATTRPELLPACVAVFVHPQDKKYKDLIGQSVITPLGDKVKVYADEKVEMDKGTGVVMVCSYGDETDLYWIRHYELEEKVILDPDGRFNEKAGELKGMSMKDGRKTIIEKLRKDGLIQREVSITHDIGVHERCGTPIEIIPTSQWFVRILDIKDEMIEVGRKVKWHPAYMSKRFEDWVNNLKWDWCISRERYYGIPVPSAICQKCGEAILPDKEDLPFNPKNLKCQCGGDAMAETAVFDTWFTSSRTPEINGYWPMSVRPQAHDIIRTWTMYTIVMSVLRHKGCEPWKDLMISGHVLAKKGQKISKKTGGGAYDPMSLVEEHSADAIRYAMYGVSLGKDGYFEDERVEAGKRLIRKLYNSTRFALSLLDGYDLKKPKLEAIDEWMLGKSGETAEKMAQKLEKYRYAKALLIFEEFYWNIFCDNYLEIIKDRLYQGEGDKKKSAQFVLRTVTLDILKMIAPFLPHIAEELYHASVNGKEMISLVDSGYFAQTEKEKSIHLLNWPEKICETDDKLNDGAGMVIKIIALARQEKEKNNIRLGAPIKSAKLICVDSDRKLIEPFLEDLKSVIRAEKMEMETGKETSISLYD